MSIFDLLSGLVTKKIVNDKVFGEIKHFRYDSVYWTGKVFFPPTGKNVSIYVRCNEGNVSEAQHQFYKEVEQKYASFTDRIAAMLQEVFGYEHGYIALEDVWDKFNLVNISIPSEEELKSPSFQWNLAYSYESEYPKFGVFMRNWEPEECYFGE